MSKSSFTLIELLIVIAIIAILAGAVILVLNPSELLAKARDSKRLADLTNLNTALSVYLSDVSPLSLGSANTLYVSLPDTSSTCANLSLPTLPSGFTYHCVTQANLTNTNDTGWLPVNLNAISSGSPISSLPIDPLNSTSTGNYYYTYATSGNTYELTSYFESNSYQSNSANDGGEDPSMYETGSNLSLTPFTHGMVGYWKFDETSGTTAYDSSGFGHNGTYASGVTLGQSGIEGTAAYFSTSTANMSAGLGTVNPPWTIVSWINLNSLQFQQYQSFVWSNSSWNALNRVYLSYGSYFNIDGYSSGSEIYASPVYFGQWSQVALVGTNKGASLYLNGVLNSTTATGASAFSAINTGASGSNLPTMDDIRVYDTALTTAQIQAIYNAKQ